MIKRLRPTAPITRRDFTRTAVAVSVSIGSIGVSTSLQQAHSAKLSPFPDLVDPPLLVDATWLLVAIQQIDNLLILDCSPRAQYESGHIPEAVHAWWQDTMYVNDPVYGTVIQPINFTDQTLRTRLLQKLGIDDDTTVVVYDDDRGRWAARFVWFLRFLGHDRVSALEGGLLSWKAETGTVESGSNDPPSRQTPTITPRENYYIGDEALVDALNDNRTLLVDVRTDDELHDDVHGTMPLGRIPGSIPFPWTTTLQDDSGNLKSAEDIQSLLLFAGVLFSRRIVLYARFGVETAHTWLVLALLGYPNFVIYDRGWAGWSANPYNGISPL